VLFQEDNTQKRTLRIAITQAGFEVVEDPYYTLFEGVRIMHGKGILIIMATRGCFFLIWRRSWY
jgi:hypothetical protein